MKKMPLCFLCLILIVIQSMIILLTGGSFLTKIPASSIFYEGKEKLVRIQGQVYRKESKSNIQLLYLKNKSKTDSKIIIYDDNFTEIPIGKSVLVEGHTITFSHARNPGGFDQRTYYAKQGIYGAVWCDEILQVWGETNLWRESLYQFREAWAQKLVEVLGEKNGNTLSAILLGKRNQMDEDTKEVYQRAGISHVLAISGLHISFIGLGLYKLLRKTGFGFVLSGVTAIFLLSIYGIMIGFSVSVFRAYVMLLLKLVAEITGRVYDMLTALMLAASIIAICEPLYLVDAAFLMSYGAILGILLIHPVICSCFPCAKKWLSGWQAGLSVNLFLFPILLYFYYEFPIYSLLLNLVVVPLMSVILALGLLGSVSICIIPVLGTVSLKICDLILDFYELFCKVVNELPMSNVVLGQPKIWQICLYYLVLTIVLLYLRRRKQTFWKKRIIWSILFIPIFFMAFKMQGRLTVTVLDVGQGDAIFMQSPKGTTYLVDGGSSDEKQIGKYCLEPFLKSRGVGALDYVFVSHGDSDHYSGIREMLNNQRYGVSIEKIVLPIHYEKDAELLELAKLAENIGTQVLSIEGGQKLQEGEFTVSCIWPTVEQELIGNEGSMVLEVIYKDFSMLLTGDVEMNGEEELVQELERENYDVLKVAHHGSDSSTSKEFLMWVNPKIAIISAGKDNPYGHPHKEVLERLQRQNCQIYETSVTGAITLITDGISLTIPEVPFRL